MCTKAQDKTIKVMGNQIIGWWIVKSFNKGVCIGVPQNQKRVVTGKYYDHTP